MKKYNVKIGHVNYEVTAKNAALALSKVTNDISVTVNSTALNNPFNIIEATICRNSISVSIID